MSDSDLFIAHVPGIQYGVLDSLMGYAIRRAQIRTYENFIAALEPWGITPPRFSAMVIVSLNPGLKLTQLAKIMGIARSGAVILVDALEELGSSPSTKKTPRVAAWSPPPPMAQPASCRRCCTTTATSCLGPPIKA